MNEFQPCALLGQLLLAGEIVTAEELREGLRRQEASGQRLGEVLVDMGATTPRQLERALRAQSRIRGRADAVRSYVLVVDDDPEVGAVVADILEGAGYRVGVAQNEAEALAAALATDPPKPTAIVLDLGLPEYGGIELLTVLRKNGTTQSIPVVVLTGRPDLEEQIRDRGLAISAFLAKPVSARQLLEVVEAAVQGSPVLREAPVA
ncbi:MAG: response regulator [Armatimonadetes bacterium]|nr:response regulator [Armatimonadota bacterium]